MIRVSRYLLVAVTMVLLAACATQQPQDDAELRNLRADLEEFRSQGELSSQVPLALAEAERAVRAAEADRLPDHERAHRIHIANKRIEIARSEAFRAQARHDIEQIDNRRTELLLRASRLEVQQARREAEEALLMSRATLEEIERTRREAMTAEEEREQASRRELEAREEADAARRLTEAQASEIELARREAELATEAAESLRRRLEYLELRETDRGVVMTLGDVLFATGETELQPDTRSNLADVVELLQTEPGKRVRIEGHTDSTGPSNVNMRLSQQRADAVRDALIEMGVDANRFNAVGMGEDFPIASNDSEEGRRRNRRVDVILLDD